ncbi:MAG: hypothetical protein LBG52_03215 [Candidatus Peribacteria bacterium]|jgi:hypothetical protein|nr:hypothetical protein [Candidatus Peribacteria bacterium]
MIEGFESALFDTVHHELKLLKNSRSILEALSVEIETILCAEGILGQVEKEHHLTLAYQKHVSAVEVINTLCSLDKIRKSIENIGLVNPHKQYDQTLHHVDARESSVNKKVCIILQPHNANNVYSTLLLSGQTSPHITLATVTCSLEIAKQQLVPKIRNLLKSHIVNQAIAADLSEIVTHTK